MALNELQDKLRSVQDKLCSCSECGPWWFVLDLQQEMCLAARCSKMCMPAQHGELVCRK
jgi:hypothetical protein